MMGCPQPVRTAAPRNLAEAQQCFSRIYLLVASLAYSLTLKIPLKCLQASTGLHGITSHKRAFFAVTAVRTSDPTYIAALLYLYSGESLGD
jgi:hypothetical protein